MPNATNTINVVNERLRTITREVGASIKRIPKIESYIDGLVSEMNTEKQNLDGLERQINIVVRENSELDKIENRYAFIERLKGKIDLLLKQRERNKRPKIQNNKYLEYSERIKEIENLLDPELIEELKKATDSEISNNATSIMKKLPTALPCTGNSIHFSSKKMGISILESAGHLIPMNKIKSDQNYLAIHVSLLLGLQQELQKRKRPVPGFVFIDQVSRPYYPAEKNSEYKKEIKLNINHNDKEVTSVKCYFDLFFDFTRDNENIQLIVLEHAYFENDERFKECVKYRWTDDTNDALIPYDWITLD